MESDIEIKKYASASDIEELYKDAEWWEESWENDKDWLNYLPAKSFIFIALYKDNEIIGMGRAISDGISDAYIQDVIVKKKFKGKGLGKLIINKLVEELKFLNIDWIGLIGKPNTKKFYEKCNFKEMVDFIPMKL